jgi:hypothetical protein
MSTPTPVSETANELTTGLGEASALEVVRLCRQADAQMFAGWRGFPGLNDTEVMTVMAQVAKAAAEVRHRTLVHSCARQAAAR